MQPRVTAFLAAVAAAAFIGGCGMMSRVPLPRKVPAAPALMEAYRQALDMVDKLEYAQAEPKLEQVSGQFEAAGDMQHTAESLFWLGFCREKLHRDDQAREIYVTVIERFPGSKPAKYARTRLDAMNGQ